MYRISKFVRCIALVLAFAGASLIAASAAFADKIYLKDGRVLEGTVVREGKDFVYFKIKVGTVENEQLFTLDQVLKIERDNPTPKTDENIKKDEAAQKADAKKDEGRHTGATRIAILNFGPPSDWQGEYGNEVGVEISAAAFKKAIPLLEKAKTDIVVIRVNSGGGYGIEADKFRDLFEKEYKPRFRTVAWIESAISAAAMSPWVLQEMYFLQKGNIGACTGWSGDLVAVKGVQLEESLIQMEKASVLGKKDPRIMRSMQIPDPLSVDIDENGEVKWRQDESGQFILNKAGDIYTMNANEAMKYKFGKGIADTKEELAKVMGLPEVEWVAADATALVDKSIKDNDSADKHNKALKQKYQLAISTADQLPDKERRGAELSKAKQFLSELRTIAKLNPNFEFHLGLSRAWFEQQDKIIAHIAQKP